MRVECPHCHAVFEVPEARAKGVKRLRCANCGDSWDLVSPAADPVAHSEILPDARSEVPADTPAEFNVPDEDSGEIPVVAEAVDAAGEARARAIGHMASRNTASRSAVLHSRSAGDLQSQTADNGPAMIGSTVVWAAAWGASLVLAGSGLATLWYCKGAGLFSALQGIGHLS